MPGMKPPQSWQIDGDIARALIGKEVITIDADDVQKVNCYRWYKPNGCTIRTRKHNKLIFLSHVIMGNNARRYDFIDKDARNYRKYNLNSSNFGKLYSKQKNNTSSIYKGVSFSKNCNQWIATTTVNVKLNYIGKFQFEYEAAKAYDEYVIKIHGSDSYTNEKMIKSGVIKPFDNENIFLEHENGTSQT